MPRYGARSPAAPHSLTVVCACVCVRHSVARPCKGTASGQPRQFATASARAKTITGPPNSLDVSVPKDADGADMPARGP
jgi:hypothetical protein